MVQFRRPEGPLPELEIYNALAERYSFAVPPSDKNSSNSEVVFEQGAFNGLAIDSVKIYRDGVVVETRTRVEDAVELIDDAYHWIETEFGYKKTEYPPQATIYTSELEIILNADLQKIFSPLKAVTDAINQLLGGYGQQYEPFVPAGAYIFNDNSSLRRGVPVPFRVERKVNEPHTENVYVSSAPLTTNDHLEILNLFESL